MKLLTREKLSERWKTSKRTIDRRRNLGQLPWLDLSGGLGSRPLVRFRLEDIEAFENEARKDIGKAEGF